MTATPLPRIPSSVYDLHSDAAIMRAAPGVWHEVDFPASALLLQELGILPAFPANEFELVYLDEGRLAGRCMVRKAPVHVHLDASSVDAAAWIMTDPAVLVADTRDRARYELRADVHARYLEWVRVYHPTIPPLGRLAFYNGLKALGYSVLKTRGNWVFIGIKLGTPDPFDP